jgi:cytochrome b561
MKDASPTAIAPRYSRFMSTIHWLTAALVLVAYVTSEGQRHVKADPPLLHFACGLAVLVLVVPRVIVRLSRGAPAPEPGPWPWLVPAARIGHGLLYALLILVPLGGWYSLSRLGVHFSVAGLTLPAITQAVDGPVGIIGDLHQIGGNALLILGGVHGAFGLWHHFALRDGTLRRMNPF